MIKILIMIAIGLAGGIIGGMGMGGGTLLIPLLTIFCGIEQHVAQTINLIAFVPLSIVALFFHIKNKLVKFKYAIWISIPAIITSILFAFLAKKVNAKPLAMYFGIFLMLLGVYQLVCILITFLKERKESKK